MRCEIWPSVSIVLEGVVPQAGGNDMKRSAVGLVFFQSGKEIEQADDVIVVDVAEHDEVELLRADDALEHGGEVVVVNVGRAAVDQ